jgi:hypothetical protein
MVIEANNHRVDEPEPRLTHSPGFTPQRLSRMDHGLEEKVADLTQQLATSQTRLQEAEVTLEDFRNGLKFETDAADRLTRENIDLNRKLRDADIEIGELQGRTQEAEIKCDRLEAENENLKGELREAKRRAEGAETRVTTLEEQIQNGEDRADQLEAANLDLSREFWDAMDRVALLEGNNREEQNIGDQPESMIRESDEGMAELEDEAASAHERIADLERQLRVAGFQTRGLQRQLQQLQESANQAQDAALPNQGAVQDHEELPLAYEKSLADGFATAQKIIDHLQTSIQEKEARIQKMQVQEELLSTEKARLENKSTELATQVDDLKLTVEKRGGLMKDAIAELGHNRERWQEEIQRNTAAEKQLREENENLREQIDMFEEQIQDMMDQLMVTDDEDENESDSRSVSSATEPGSRSDHPEDEDEGNGRETPSDHKRHPLSAPSTTDDRDSSSGDEDDSKDLADTKGFLAQVATLYQRQLVAWNNLKAGEITVQAYERQQAEVKIELNAIRLTPSRDHAFKEWSSLRRDIRATGGAGRHMSFLKETITLMASSRKGYQVVGGGPVQFKEVLESLLRRVPKARKRSYEATEMQGWRRELIARPTKRSRTS